MTTTRIAARSLSRRRVLAGGAALAALGLAAPSWSTRDVLAVQDASGAEIKMLIRKPETLNPLFSTSGNEQQIGRLIFGALVKSDNNLQPVPDLAESVDASPDALTYTFKLREGLVFNDGEPLTVKDVVFTIERAVQKETASSWQGRLLAIAGAKEFSEGGADAISGLETPDDRTIKITLAEPDATFLLTLADYSGLGILPEHALKDVAPDQLQNMTFLEPAVSGGAFELVSYQVDQFIELKRNDKYTVSTPALERIILPIRTPAVALGEIETGALDIMRLPLAEVDRVSAMNGVTLVSVPSPSMDHIVLNLTRPFFQDKRVRQAMLYAIDRATIVETLLQNRGEVVNSPIFGPDWMGVPAGLNEYAYDPEKAKSLLAEAGWDGNQTVTALTVPPNEEWWSEIVAQQLNDVGIKFQLQQVEGSQLVDAILAETPDFDCFLNGGDTYRADPNISSLFFSTPQIAPAGANFSRYSNPDLDALYVKGRATNDLAARKTTYTEAAKILNEDAPVIYLWSPNSFFAVRDRVEGFVGPGYVDNRLWNAETWSVKS